MNLENKKKTAQLEKQSSLHKSSGAETFSVKTVQLVKKKEKGKGKETSVKKPRKRYYKKAWTNKFTQFTTEKTANQEKPATKRPSLRQRRVQ